MRKREKIVVYLTQEYLLQNTHERKVNPMAIGTQKNCAGLPVNSKDVSFVKWFEKEGNSFIK